MPIFSKSSFQKLFTCDKQLQTLMEAVIKEKDIIILCGHRTQIDQDKFYDQGKTQVRYPNSKHNSDPSRAVDFAPYHVDEPHIQWNNIDEFHEFIDFILAKANDLGIKVRSGRDFSFHDFDHIELVD